MNVMKYKSRAIILFISIFLISFAAGISAAATDASDIRIDGINYPNLVTDDIFWFVQISDIHIGKSVIAENNLKWIVQNVPRFIKPEFVIATGDLTDSLTELGRKDQWITYNYIINSDADFAGKYYDIPGNHDRYGDPDWNGYISYSRSGFLQNNTNPNDPVGEFVWTVNSPATDRSYLFISANTNDEEGHTFAYYLPHLISDIPELSNAELNYIEDNLRGFYIENRFGPKPQLSFIFGHHGLYTWDADFAGYKNISWLPGLADWGIGGTELQEKFRNWKVSSYLYGHTHADGEFFDSSTLQLNTGALLDGRYRIVAVDNNGVSTTVGSIDSWPAVMITSPIDKKLGSANPYAPVVPKTKTNPVRALIFNDPQYCSIEFVSFAVDNAQIGAMQRVSDNPADRTYNVWNGLWDSTSASAGEHKIDVLVKCVEQPAPTADTITVDLDFIPSPNGQEAFSYPPSVSPDVSTNPSVANPIGVGTVAEGGNMLSLRVSLPQFSDPVDIYGAFISSAHPATVNILKADLTFQAFSVEEVNKALSTGIPAAGMTPWRANTTGPIDESLYADIPVSTLSNGTYNLYMLVTPAGSLNTYYLWKTYFSVAAP